MKRRGENKRMTMHEAIFYRLYAAHREATKNGKVAELIPVFGFMGEIFSSEIRKWGFVSHECSARVSEIHTGNPGLLYRERMTGKSGAKYYGYRISTNARAESIKDPTLASLYTRLRAKMPV